MHLIYPTGILSAHNGINVYRGCTHGCIYCDSRSECYQFDHPFEDVAVKANAPELLDQALRRKRSPVVVSTGAMCDPYIPPEAELQLTRRCLEVVLRHGCGATVQTKSDLVLRDLELLRQIHERAPASVQMTLTTADDALCRRVEPNVCPTSRRLDVLRACRDAGLPTVVWISPLLPFINDTEENLRALLTACRDAGVMGFRMYGYGLTLRAGSREYYYTQLDRRFPGLRSRYEQRFGRMYELPSPNHLRLAEILEGFCDAHGLLYRHRDLDAALYAFHRRDAVQTSLFDAPR